MNLENVPKKKRKNKSLISDTSWREAPKKKGKSRLRHLLERGSKKNKTKSIVAYTSWREVPKKKSKSLIADTSWREVSKKKKVSTQTPPGEGFQTKKQNLGRDRKNGIWLLGVFFELNF